MRLQFKILWLEDDDSFVSSLTPRIETFLDERGFEAKFKRLKAGSGLRKMLDENKFDLILVDFKLKRRVKGNTLINRIRDLEIYTTIIFYSEHKDFFKTVSDKFRPEGVFHCQGRTNLLDKIKKIVNMVLKKNLEIENLRGLFISETIDLFSDIDKALIKSLQIKKKKMDFFSDKVLEQNFFGDFEKFRILKRALETQIEQLTTDIKTETNDTIKQQKIDKKTKLLELKSIFARVNKEVIEIRNCLAHAQLLPESNNILIARPEGKKKPLTFDEDRVIKICKDVRRHQKNLQEMIKHL
jgi:hypothetical protein